MDCHNAIKALPLLPLFHWQSIGSSPLISKKITLRRKKKPKKRFSNVRKKCKWMITKSCQSIKFWYWIFIKSWTHYTLSEFAFLWTCFRTKIHIQHKILSFKCFVYAKTYRAKKWKGHQHFLAVFLRSSFCCRPQISCKPITIRSDGDVETKQFWYS